MELVFLKNASYLLLIRFSCDRLAPSEMTGECQLTPLDSMVEAMLFQIPMREHRRWPRGNTDDEQSNGKHIGHSNYREHSDDDGRIECIDAFDDIDVGGSDDGIDYEKDFEAEQAKEDSTSTTL